MTWLGLFFIILGIFYLIYSIVFRRKPTIYFKNLRMIKGKEDKYLRLQLYFAIFNSLIFISVGFIVIRYRLESFYLILTPLILHFINSMVKAISKTKGYVES